MLPLLYSRWWGDKHLPQGGSRQVFDVVSVLSRFGSPRLQVRLD